MIGLMEDFRYGVQRDYNCPRLVKTAELLGGAQEVIIILKQRNLGIIFKSLALMVFGILILNIERYCPHTEYLETFNIFTTGVMESNGKSINRRVKKINCKQAQFERTSGTNSQHAFSAHSPRNKLIPWILLVLEIPYLEILSTKSCLNWSSNALMKGKNKMIEKNYYPKNK